MLQRISYSLNEHAPGWPGNPTLQLTPVSQISEVRRSNTFQFTLFNHYGSHMDGPKHFNDKGPRLAELPLERFIYEKPLLVDIPLTYEQLVSVDDLRPYEEQLSSADALLIRSGFPEIRVKDPEGYSHRGPGISSEACQYLMDRFPQLKAVAMDWLSLASYANNEDGVLAHQILLGMYHDHFICIIEDLNFTGIAPKKLRKVLSIPLFIEGIDSAPVTVLADIMD